VAAVSGSISAIWGGSQLVSIDPSPKFVCDARQGDTVTAPFKIRNVTHQSIILLGAKTSCGCTVAEGLPLDLEPGASGTVNLQVKIGEQNMTGHFAKTVLLFNNRDGVVPPLVFDARVIRTTADHL
jgi:hypothetical protein